jgi:hypothetical protein
MAGSQNGQGSDQFSLVSLEKNSQRAASSYSSMSRRARGESDSTLSINEDEAQEAKASPAAAPAKAAAQEAKPKKKAPSKEPVAANNDRVDQSIDDILGKFEEFNSSLRSLLTNASQAGRNIMVVLLTPLIPLLNRLLRLLNGPLLFINAVTRRINERMQSRSGRAPAASAPGGDMSAVDDDDTPMVEAAPPPVVAPAKRSNFSDMIELNIVFTDNMKKPLYKRKPNMPGARMGAMEEDLILSNAMIAINECAEFTLELPNPSSGLYAGQRIYDIMANVAKEDVGVFLGFVKAYPGKYIGKEWKISETFATWLINNAPVPD